MDLVGEGGLSDLDDAGFMGDDALQQPSRGRAGSKKQDATNSKVRHFSSQDTFLALHELTYDRRMYLSHAIDGDCELLGGGCRQVRGSRQS